jgi:hypothetical protein
MRYEVFKLGFSCSIAFLGYLASALLTVECSHARRWLLVTVSTAKRSRLRAPSDLESAAVYPPLINIAT